MSTMHPLPNPWLICAGVAISALTAILGTSSANWAPLAAAMTSATAAATYMAALPRTRDTSSGRTFLEWGFTMMASLLTLLLMPVLYWIPVHFAEGSPVFVILGALGVTILCAVLTWGAALLVIRSSVPADEAA